MSDLPRLIGVHGRKRSGKGTTADFLVAQHGYVVVKFADPLKDMLRVLLRYWDFDEATIERAIEGDLKEVPFDQLGGKTSRFAMQTLGTEWREMIDRGLWVNIAANRIRNHWSQGQRVVVDDLRFPHEFDTLDGLGARLFYVRNPRNEEQTQDGHASEKILPLDRFHARFLNDDSFEHLYGQIREALSCGIQTAA